MNDWTKQQENAIYARNRNILVSAAAGSGKTSVLTERVIELISGNNKQTDIDRLLVVTFTNAAAAEMKHRISQRLAERIKEDPDNRQLREQLDKLSGAKITTIDAFCSSLVREHFYELGINQDFKTLDESEYSVMQSEVISEVINRRFEEDRSDGFMTLIECYTTESSDRNLTALIKKVMSFIYAQPFPFKWLRDVLDYHNTDKPFEETIWFEYLKNEITKLLDFGEEHIIKAFDFIAFNDTKDEEFREFLNWFINEINKYREALSNGWDELCSLPESSFPRFPDTRNLDKTLTGKIQSERNICKSILESEVRGLLICSSDEYVADAEQSRSILNALYEVIKEVDERLREEKDIKNAYTFSDITHFAINLLFTLDENGNFIKTPLAKTLQKSYDEILIDEYQDTNETQDKMFTYLSNGNNLFVVGDVKQSIYRFRLAMPEIFTERRKRYKLYDENDGENSSTIILDKNFRSRKGICDFVNFTFSALMSEEVGELDYNEEEYLNYNEDSYPPETTPCVQFKILNNIKKDADTYEAHYIAQLILDKINSGELITDGKIQRPVRFSDFTIMMRSLKDHINTFSTVFALYGIPTVCENSTNLFENNEIKIILSLLRCINNPTNEIPLLATMMSPMYSFTDDELAQIRINNRAKSFYQSVAAASDEKTTAFLKDIKELRSVSVTMSVAGFIRYLVETKGIDSFVSAMGNAEQRYQNIIMLISFAESFDKGVNVGLTAFLRYIDAIINSDKKVDSAALSPTGDDAVTFMTIHHSKGLEFPICILPGVSKTYNKDDFKLSYMINTKLGIAFKKFELSKTCIYPTIPYAVISDKNLYEFMSENLRVLYVAMTRAKEQFIPVFSLENAETRLNKLSVKIDKNGINPYFIKNLKNNGDALLMTALMHKDAKELHKLIPDNEIVIRPSDFSLSAEIIESVETDTEAIETSDEEYDENILNTISEKLRYKYDREELSTLSPKLVASSLDDIDKSFDYIASAKPSFASKAGLTPAERGTAMHEFMQYCDYSRAKVSIEDEVKRLVSDGSISAEQAASLNTEALHKFFTSEFAERMFSSDCIYKEIKTSSFVSASELYDTDYDDKVLIQGIADCVFEEKDGLVLIDYKTDKVESEEQLLDRYRNQIAFYKQSISKRFGKPVKLAALYSFYLGKICEYK